MKFSTIPLLYLLFITTTHAQSDYSFGVRVTGKGKPMILIPGNKGSADTYNDVVAHFKDRYTCYVITLAGFAGQPPSGAHDHLLMKQRDDIIRFIADEHLQKPVLVGFSFGGTLATWVACTRPDLIGAFIDLDGTPFDAAVDDYHLNKDSLVRADSARYAKALALSPDDWRKRDSAFHTDEGYQAGMAWMKRLISDTTRVQEIWQWDKASDMRTGMLMNLEADTLDLRDAIAAVQCPILMLGSWQGYDMIKTKADAEKQYAKQYAKAHNVTLVFSKKGKHFLMYEDFEWMVGEMDTFLKKYT